MGVPIYQVNAFTHEPFHGNPAAVCVLHDPQPEAWMQAVAKEMNLSETAFISPMEEGWQLRWFTPSTEVPLCGHATMASAFVLRETGRCVQKSPIRFHTRWSGTLIANQSEGNIELELPAISIEQWPPPDELIAALELSVVPDFVGITPIRGNNDRDYLIVLHSEDDVRACHPNFDKLSKINAGIILSARSESGECDFISRYFVPFIGIDEDPVTGVAHCSLVPYWSQRLRKSQVIGYQASTRGGFVYGRREDDRVFLSGKCCMIWRGELIV